MDLGHRHYQLFHQLRRLVLKERLRMHKNLSSSQTQILETKDQMRKAGGMYTHNSPESKTPLLVGMPQDLGRQTGTSFPGLQPIAQQVLTA